MRSFGKNNVCMLRLMSHDVDCFEACDRRWRGLQLEVPYDETVDDAHFDICESFAYMSRISLRFCNLVLSNRMLIMLVIGMAEESNLLTKTTSEPTTECLHWSGTTIIFNFTLVVLNQPALRYKILQSELLPSFSSLSIFTAAFASFVFVNRHRGRLVTRSDSLRSR